MTARLAAAACALAATVLAAPAARADGRPNRLTPVAVRTGGPAPWVASDGRLVAYGAAARVVLEDIDGVRLAAGDVGREVRGAAVAGRRVYLDTPDEILVVEFRDGAAVASPFPADVLPGAARVLARAGDGLLVFEQGRGLRALALPLPAGHPPLAAHAHHGPPAAGAEIASLAIADRVVALAASGRTVFAATDAGAIRVFRLDAAGVPVAAGSFPAGGEVRGLAANGDRLYLLGGGELRVVQFAAGGDRPAGVVTYAGAEGEGLALSGRLVLLASGAAGVSVGREDAAAATTHVVTVTSFDFTPQDLAINVGDTVEWRCTAGFHDVDSCNVGEPGCTANATEAFSSGAAKTAPWTYSKTFTRAGPDPYTCTVHAGFGMVGTVTVSAPAAAPPAIPDGRNGTTALRVTKTDAGGSSLQVAFDAASCAGLADTRIVGGTDAQLPTTPGGTYAASLSRCACGTTSPCTWTGSPKPAPGHMIWFVMLGTDAGGVEGSWGTDSAGNERKGPGGGGSSGQCGATARNITNRCGT